MKITTAKLTDKVDLWQKRLSPLGIGHFRVESVNLTDDVPVYDDTPGSSQAGVSFSENYDSVRFYFDNTYIDNADESTVDETIIHEWLHVAFRDAEFSMKEAQDWMPFATWDMYRSRVERNLEVLVERLARTIYAAYKAKT